MDYREFGGKHWKRAENRLVSTYSIFRIKAFWCIEFISLFMFLYNILDLIIRILIAFIRCLIFDKHNTYRLTVETVLINKSF